MLSLTHSAGDTFTGSVSSPAFPASAGWVGKLRLVSRAAGPAPIEATATADGDDHLFSVAATTTAAWVAGAYSRIVWVERAGEIRTLSQDQFAITPDLRTLSAGTDTRSLPRRTLDDLLAARAQWATTQGRTKRYKIADREREFASAADLNAEIDFWQRQLAAEESAARLAAGLKPRNRILTRFVRPG